VFCVRSPTQWQPISTQSGPLFSKEGKRSPKWEKERSSTVGRGVIVKDWRSTSKVNASKKRGDFGPYEREGRLDEPKWEKVKWQAGKAPRRITHDR